MNCEAPDVLVLEKLWESGVEVSQEYFARTGSGSCEPRSLPDGYRAYSTSAEITNALPALSLRTE